MIPKKNKSICYRGDGNPNWKGGIKYQDGYILVYSPNHPHRSSHVYVFEHRLVMEKFLGRFLSKNELVHHKNGNRADNKIGNLELVTRRTHQGEVRCPYCLGTFIMK